MKQLLLFAFLISGTAHAIDFYKVTGSFDVKASEADKFVGSDTLAEAAYGSFELGTNDSRSPASVNSDSQNSSSSVTELTRTFE